MQNIKLFTTTKGLLSVLSLVIVMAVFSSCNDDSKKAETTTTADSTVVKTLPKMVDSPAVIDSHKTEQPLPPRH